VLRALRPARRTLSFSKPPAPPEISTLSLRDALPICDCGGPPSPTVACAHGNPYALPPWLMPHMHTPYRFIDGLGEDMVGYIFPRSEEHTSELQSRENLVCRLLLEKKKRTDRATATST